MISLNNIFVKRFGKKILQNISFNINEGSIISLIGQNGAGKSTLCKLLIGAIKPSSGEIIRNTQLKISYVPQIFERNIMIPLKVKDFLLLGNNNNDTKKTKKHLENLIENLNIENILSSTLNNLSGGEMQKVLLLRALIRKPNLLILDESFTFLDISSLIKLHQIIFEEQQKLNFTIILISHDIDFVLKNTKYVICLKNGKIHCNGTCENIKENPYIKDIIGIYNHEN